MILGAPIDPRIAVDIGSLHDRRSMVAAVARGVRL